VPLPPGKPMQDDLAESSKGPCATNALARRCSPHWLMPVRARGMAVRLQNGQTTFETGREDPRRDRRRTCLGPCPGQSATSWNSNDERARLHLWM